MNSREFGIALLMAGASLSAQQLASFPPSQQPAANYPPALVEAGRAQFQRDCAFCHGREAGGGESGPDLTRSMIVAKDVDGSAIAPLVRAGVPDKGMPPFRLSDEDMKAVVAFIHASKTRAESQKGGRRGVDPSDLQTGNAGDGKKYFQGAGGCAGCHSPEGDLAHIASKYRGLQLLQRMLAPRNAKSTVTVTTKGGQTFTGTLAYQDEFVIALRDADGKHRSWFVENVKFKIDSPAEAHTALFPKYTDKDIHDLMAYIQTLK